MLCFVDIQWRWPGPRSSFGIPSLGQDEETIYRLAAYGQDYIETRFGILGVCILPIGLENSLETRCIIVIAPFLVAQLISMCPSIPPG